MKNTCTMFAFFLLVQVLTVSAEPVHENLVMGTPADDEVAGTVGLDHFFGGAGADLFVIDRLSPVPDQIIDFDAKEGDEITFRFEHPRLFEMKTDQLEISRKGIITWRPAPGTNIPLIGINDEDVRFVIDRSKKGVFLKIDKTF